jgi:hypothetical protein
MTTFQVENIKSAEILRMIREKLLGLESCSGLRKDSIVLCEFEISGVSDGIVRATVKLRNFFCEKFGFDNILYVGESSGIVRIGVFPVNEGGKLSATTMFSSTNLRNLKEGISEISGNNVNVVGTRRLVLDPTEELNSVVRLCLEVNELRDECDELKFRVSDLDGKVDRLTTVVEWLVDGIRCFAPELYSNMMSVMDSLPYKHELGEGMIDEECGGRDITAC